MSDDCIRVRGVRVHNLRDVDLDIPRNKLVAFCGVSGSGKTSLALDTLYAEGQRRYIESFSAYTRQFLERLDKPDADRIDGLPPAIAITHKDNSSSSRSTIGAATEIDNHLRLLFARIGRIYCHGCGREVRRESASTVASQINDLPVGTRYMIALTRSVARVESLEATINELREDGFVRVIAAGKTWNLSAGESPGSDAFPMEVLVVIDRLTVGDSADQRVIDSLETAFASGGGRCIVLVSADPRETNTTKTIDGREWVQRAFATALTCEDCQIEFPAPDPRLYSYNSPLGACPVCEGFGNLVETDMDLVVPDPSKSLAEGAIAPWNTPAYKHELEELLALASEYDLPVDIPFAELEDRHLALIRDGVPERKFGGLKGFFAWLEKRKYKMHLRVFLSRWRSYRPCPACQGARLRHEALATKIGGRSISEVLAAKIVDSLEFFRTLEISDWDRRVGRTMLEQVQGRLGYLIDVGLGYLTLDRTLRTISNGEAQRVTLTSALGSSLVNMLYVLDEPSVGLHPRDVDRLIKAVASLRDRSNTVVVVEHEEAMLRAADHIVEVGPGAGERGGQIVFEGTLGEMEASPTSMTGDYLMGRRGIGVPERRRQPGHGWVRLVGARGNNLQNLTVEFPLGVLCLVTGVSGAGKSTLVQDTLYGALCARKRKNAAKPHAYDDVYGDGQIDDVILIDQSPIGRSPRSNPVTYVKAFDEIRAVFAETIEARTHNYTASHFSFNVDGGRCTACNGDGHVEIDMQFLADVYMKCDQCHGTRYRSEILDVTYRGRNIAEVLDMTIREAFAFFRGQPKTQKKLKRLIDVGLDYLRLGQPANTLSAGEAQRLKLASYISSAKRNRTLFIMDEPTTGLHYSDIVQLLDCFEALLSVGHSLIVVEHNLQMMKAADYIIDIGPGAAEEGGNVVVQGTPEKVARCAESITGRFLADALGDSLKEQTA
ncbi:MAG: excinuclease ABC subunit UvrA [Planctomycetaceae bacterium]|nr:excinuclease ABC subunit UvrA [Planctomycetales bacterium]MCB9923993.1 excinuclease ABC subunit UvrA [Planctomycetaceae bacterium]